MDQLPVGIFWDFENVHPPSGTSGYVVVSKIRQFVEPLGCVSVFKAYLDVNLEAGKAAQQHELQSSGVSLIHTPHNAKKEVADKVLIVDLMIFALESQTLKTIVLITGDQDFSYAASMLRLKGHRIFVVHPFPAPTPSLKNVAHEIFSWRVDVLERSTAVTENLASPTKGCSAPHATLTLPVAPLQLDPSERKSPAKDASGEGLRTISSKPALCCSCSELLLFAAENGSVNDMVVESGHLCAESPWSQPMLRLQTTLSEFANDASQVSAALPLDADPWSGQKGHPPKPKCPVHDDDSSSVLHAVGDEDKPADQSLDVEKPLASRQDGVLINESTPETDMEEEHSYGTDTESPLDQSVVSTPIYDECDAQEHIIFLDLIKVLKDERNRGRVSTPYDCLEVLLLQEDPWIFEQAGARGLKDYLELAERAAVVSCISTDGKLNDCHVFLLDVSDIETTGDVAILEGHSSQSAQRLGSFSPLHTPQEELKPEDASSFVCQSAPLLPSTSDAQKSLVPLTHAVAPHTAPVEGTRSGDDASGDNSDGDSLNEAFNSGSDDSDPFDKEGVMLRTQIEAVEKRACKLESLDSIIQESHDIQGRPTVNNTVSSASIRTRDRFQKAMPSISLVNKTAHFKALIKVLKDMGASTTSIRQSRAQKALLKHDRLIFNRSGSAEAYFKEACKLGLIKLTFGTTKATKNQPHIILCLKPVPQSSSTTASVSLPSTSATFTAPKLKPNIALTINPSFSLLIDVLINLGGSRGTAFKQKTVRDALLSRDPLVFTHMSPEEVSTYFERAEANGIVSLGQAGAGKKKHVKLCPTYR